jgi:glycosyltransferase involved in cell wall biosynthesis
MRILFLSFLFPPFNGIGCVRTGKTAKYLTKLGHDVRVISAREQDLPSASLPVEIPSDHVIYTYWFNPRRSLEHLFGRGRVGPWPEGDGAAGAPSRRRLAGELLRFVRAAYFPDHQIGWVPFATRAATRLLRTWRPDVILASGGPASSLIAAHRVARRHRIPWVADLRDLWTDFHYYQHPAWRRHLEERVERRVLTSAAGLVTVSQPLADILERKFHRPTAVILNGFDPADYPQPSELSYRNGPLRIVYTGHVYAGRQTPAALFAALQRLGPAAQHVRVVFYGAIASLIRDEARRQGVEGLVEIHDAVPHHDVLKIQSEADVLLHLLWNDPNQNGVYNAKVFEYLGARRPILAVGYTENVAAQLIRERGAGATLNDPVQIATQIETWMRQKDATGTIPALPASVSAGLSREEQTKNLETFLTRMLSAPQ